MSDIQSGILRPSISQTDMMNLLTTSEIFKIKREIGGVFWNCLMQAEVKLILRKVPQLRTEREIEILAKFIKKYHHIKNFNLGIVEYREMA